MAIARQRFELPDGVIYLDGNSLGARPRGVVERVQSVIVDEWGRDLIASWNAHGWMELPHKVGDRIGSLIGAAAGQVVMADSTSVNLYKLLHGALALRPDRTTIVTEAENFPSDRYLIDAVARQRSCAVVLADAEAIVDAIDANTALVCLTHVNYRTGRMHDMAAITAAAHRVGALVLWDLAHSAGAVPVELDGCDVDFAVGCTYKFLNGGPGSPAFVYVAQRLHDLVHQPITGWLGHAEPFAMRPTFEPVAGIGRFLAGTPPVLALAVLDAALDAFDGVSMHAVHDKMMSLSELFIARVDATCDGRGLSLASPADPLRRGSQVSFTHEHGYGVIQALIERGVVGDYREPAICRFGLAPLYLRHTDIWDAVDHLADVLQHGEHIAPRFQQRLAVT